MHNKTGRSPTKYSRLALALASVLAVAGVSGPVLAQQVDCAQAVTTQDMVICAGQELEAADKRLNDTYGEIGAGLDTEGKRLLKEAQRAWIAFRDWECARQADAARGGTLSPVLEVSCLSALTEQRARQLKQSGNLAEGPDRSLYWDPQLTFQGRYTCSKPVQAQIGVMATYKAETGQPIIKVRVAFDGRSFDLGVGEGTQDSLCGPAVTVTTIEGADGCDTLRIDDGLCDAFFVGWDKELQWPVWRRN